MKLKPGVVIEHKKTKYVGEIPDDVFKSIYGKDTDKMKKKFKFVEVKSDQGKNDTSNAGK